MLVNVMGAIEAGGAQPQVSQAQAAVAMPPGLPTPAVAQLAQPQPQAVAPLQAQVVAEVVAVNVPGGHPPIHPQPHKKTKHNLNKHKSNNHRCRRRLKLMREV